MSPKISIRCNTPFFNENHFKHSFKNIILNQNDSLAYLASANGIQTLKGKELHNKETTNLANRQTRLLKNAPNKSVWIQYTREPKNRI